MLGGYALLLLLRYLPLEASLTTVLGVAGVLALFGAAQLLHTSGFLAIYIAAVMAGSARYPARDEIGHFFEGLAWLSQIVLFLMLGLLVTPHQLVPLIVPAVLATMVLILVARPVAVFACMLPFGYDLRETTFAAWVGLRGAVPIYLCIVPAIEYGHVETMAAGPGGYKGVGEGGAIGAPAAVINAVVDALAPFGVTVDRLPLSPQMVVALIERAEPNR